MILSPSEPAFIRLENRFMTNTGAETESPLHYSNVGSVSGISLVLLEIKHVIIIRWK